MINTEAIKDARISFKEAISGCKNKSNFSKCMKDSLEYDIEELTRVMDENNSTKIYLNQYKKEWNKMLSNTSLKESNKSYVKYIGLNESAADIILNERILKNISSGVISISKKFIERVKALLMKIKEYIRNLVTKKYTPPYDMKVSPEVKKYLIKARTKLEDDLNTNYGIVNDLNADYV
jgi:hypothetical protein